MSQSSGVHHVQETICSGKPTRHIIVAWYTMVLPVIVVEPTLSGALVGIKA